MSGTTSPYAEAWERIGDAVVDNAADFRTRASRLAGALEKSNGSTSVDGLANAWMSMWLGGLRATAVAAAATIDAAGILAMPPQPFDVYPIDLAAIVPSRVAPADVAVGEVGWASTNSKGSPPAAKIVSALPLAPPSGPDDLLLIRLAPSPGKDSVTIDLTITIDGVVTTATVQALQANVIIDP